jgi:hypothetical protein
VHPRFWRLPLQFDAAALQADLAQLATGAWPTHFNTGYHDGGWGGVALIAPDGDATRLYPNLGKAGPAQATPLLDRCPALRAAVAALPGVPQSARLLRLVAGSVIREHRDYGLGLDEGLLRLHVPILTHPQVEFYLDGVCVPMTAGECWYLDFALPHRVQNLGAHERVHLVVDCALDDTLRAMLPTVEDSERQMQALRATAPETSMQRFERFRAQVFRDARLQEALCNIEDSAALAERAVELGREQALRFTTEDVHAALNAGRRAWRRGQPA